MKILSILRSRAFVFLQYWCSKSLRSNIKPQSPIVLFQAVFLFLSVAALPAVAAEVIVAEVLVAEPIVAEVLVAEPIVAEPSESNNQAILITVNHDSDREASAFNGFNRINLGRRDYQSILAAKRIMGNIVEDYNLEDLDQGWQISSLGVYCGVFNVNSNENIVNLLGRLARDDRIDSAQKMFDYAALSSASYDGFFDLSSAEKLSQNGSPIDGDIHLKSQGIENAEAIESGIESFDQTRLNTLLSYNDTYFEKQYGDSRRAVEVLHNSSTGKGVRVALIDTGLDVGHQEFRGRKIKMANFVDSDNAQFMRDKHGTAVAGVIAARPNNALGIVGLAPDVSIAAIKACWHDNTKAEKSARCNSLTLAAALDRAIQLDSHIINMSLAGPSDPLVSRLILSARKNGAILIAADPQQGNFRFPALMPEVLAVVNRRRIDTDGTSDQGFYIAGNDVLSTVPGGHFDFYSGSSLSAARATALIAHSLERAPEQDWDLRMKIVTEIAESLGMR